MFIIIATLTDFVRIICVSLHFYFIFYFDVGLGIIFFSYFLHFVLNHVFFTITLYLLAEYCTGNDMWKNCDGKKQTQKLL